MQAPTSLDDDSAYLSRIGYLERYFDSAAKLPELDRKGWERREVDRLAASLARVIVAEGITRRLGPEATREENALDKKRARRVGHALRTSLHAWQRKIPQLPADQEVQIEGAQIVWESFGPAHLAVVRSELILVSTWAVMNEQRRWGRSCVTKLENEIKWTEYALRD